MIGIIDCNNFYASSERVFNPKIQKSPVVVLSNNDGAVIARSEEAKRLGIDMTTPMFQVKQLIEKFGVVQYSSNYTLYGDMSSRVKSIIRMFAPQVEDYSIDESFVDLSGFEYINLHEHVKKMRDSISNWSGVPVSIGVAASKTLSKLANRIAKKQYRSYGVYIIDSEDKRIDALKNAELKDIWGVGSAISAKLKASGMYNAYDLSIAPDDVIRRNYSVVLQRTVLELRGISCIPLEIIPEDKQFIGSQKGFGIKQTKFEPLAEALANYTARVCEKLRKQKCVAGGMEVWLGTDDFSKTEAQYYPRIKTVNEVPTDYTPYMIKRGVEALHRIYRPGFIYKRVGVMLTDIRSKSDGTLSLFFADRRDKENKLIHQIDRINRLNGRDTIRSAQQSITGNWRMRQENLSPCYTTRLSDIILIR